MTDDIHEHHLYRVTVRSGRGATGRTHSHFIRARCPREAYDLACGEVELRGEPTPTRGEVRHGADVVLFRDRDDSYARPEPADDFSDVDFGAPLHRFGGTGEAA